MQLNAFTPNGAVFNAPPPPAIQGPAVFSVNAQGFNEITLNGDFADFAAGGAGTFTMNGRTIHTAAVNGSTIVLPFGSGEGVVVQDETGEVVYTSDELLSEVVSTVTLVQDEITEYLYQDILGDSPQEFDLAVLHLEIQVTAPSGQAALQLQITVQGEGDATLPLEIEVGPPQGEASMTLEVVVFGVGDAVAPLEIIVFDADDFLPGPGDTYCWEAEVILNGVDVSASLLETLEVEAEEGAARIANFTLLPAMGIIELTDWVGAPVQISFVRRDPITLQITSKIRLFTGFVDVPEYDPNTRITKYQCTDNLQQKMEQLDRDTITDLVGGLWSKWIFDEEADNWTYTQDRLSTVPAAFDISPAGALRAPTPWLSNPTPDFTFDVTNIVDESLGVTLEDFRSILTEIELDFDYTFERLRERHARWSWSYPGDFCNYSEEGHTIPRRDMIQGAAEGTSWVSESIAFVPLPPSGLIFGCPTAAAVKAWVNTESGFGPLFCLGANGILAKRFAQAIKELYLIKLIAPQIELEFGMPVIEKRSHSIRSEYDTDKWEDSLDAPEAKKQQLIPIPDSSDDFYVDVDGEPVASRAEVDEAINVAISQGRATLLDSHRGNLVEFTVPIVPTIDVIHTIEIDTETLDARGKVAQVVHSMDISTGEAISRVTLAISKSNGTPVVDTPVAPPPIPDTVSQMSAPDGTVVMGSRYGGQLGGTARTGGGVGGVKSDPIDPEEDPPFNGYTGNRQPADAGSIVYSTTFGFNTDEVDANDRDEIEAEQPFEYSVNIPDDLLVMSA